MASMRIGASRQRIRRPYGRVCDRRQKSVCRVQSSLYLGIAVDEPESRSCQSKNSTAMLDNRYDPSLILANYPAERLGFTSATEAVAGGGFSGSRLWRLRTGQGMLCLRRWPAEYSDQSHLKWMHGVLAGVFKAGFRLIPIPLETVTGQSFVLHDGFLWQLEPWLRGEAEDGPPPFRGASAARVVAAMTALGEFHRAVAVDPANHLPDAAAPGMLKRLALLEALRGGGMDRLIAAAAANGANWPELANRASGVFEVFHPIAPRMAELLRQTVGWMVPVRPCIRDIHRQHVLFDGDRVAGIVDFGAMQPDSVAADIARLLGSLAMDNADLWQAGLRAYQQVNVLTQWERLLVELYDQSGVLLSGIHWLQWVFIEGRQFENRPAVLARVEEILLRLARLSERMSTKSVTGV
jgi:Ser/Thr protein kinase RdoA (MazF antagonist)